MIPITLTYHHVQHLINHQIIKIITFQMNVKKVTSVTI
ncbi:hypothetical protein BLA29_012419 [Euroglyphus maynei]|uniref:Uncharacterized protein n=1 Tax=Euroglyphus maynei TaxID=6958 RepID=A0A1Y3B2A6_EURMA|nr:hypothetical protein BLA29_012419 [Euroglyphus maynei]